MVTLENKRAVGQVILHLAQKGMFLLYLLVLYRVKNMSLDYTSNVRYIFVFLPLENEGDVVIRV